MSENLKKEEKHLHKVLQSNGYDNAMQPLGQALKSYLLKITQILSKRKFDSYYSVHIRIE